MLFECSGRFQVRRKVCDWVTSLDNPSWRVRAASFLLRGTGFEVTQAGNKPLRSIEGTCEQPAAGPSEQGQPPLLPSDQPAAGPARPSNDGAVSPLNTGRVSRRYDVSPEGISQEAQRLLALAASRMAGTAAGSVAVSKVELGDKAQAAVLKSKIVGKDGRNIKVFQERSGVDLVLNDEIDRVGLSSFDPFRREVARVALQSLIVDGKINPPKIEQALSEAKAQVDKEVRRVATAALDKLNIKNVSPAIVRVLGTLNLRSSFGQNQLAHSVECAELAGLIASELGVDPTLAKRAALFHDLGKALDQDHEGPHAAAGADFARKYGESDEVVHAIAAHHEEIECRSVLGDIVIAADALSGARPGARPASSDQLAKRSKQLEQIALEFPGVQTAFAMQAGRELRILVRADQTSDVQMNELLDLVAGRIRTELKFPGNITLTATREVTASRQVSL